MQIKEYLNKICEQIKYKPVREEISKEIEDHINDIKEDLIKDGANETTAEIKAINQMGNAEEIGRKLNKIHKPKLDWKLLIINNDMPLLEERSLLKTDHQFYLHMYADMK